MHDEWQRFLRGENRCQREACPKEKNGKRSWKLGKQLGLVDPSGA